MMSPAPPAEAARQAAEEALLNRAISPVSREVYAQFLARLDEEPKPNERLSRTRGFARIKRAARG
jgi:uncharacterized protein (DUF1778 family)